MSRSRLIVSVGPEVANAWWCEVLGRVWTHADRLATSTPPLSQLNTCGTNTLVDSIQNRKTWPCVGASGAGVTLAAVMLAVETIDLNKIQGRVPGLQI